MSKLKEEIDTLIAIDTPDGDRFFRALDSVMTELSFSSIKEIEDMLKIMDVEHDKYFGLLYCVRTVAFKILLSSRPQDENLRKWALYYIDFEGDPGDVEEFERNI